MTLFRESTFFCFNYNWLTALQESVAASSNVRLNLVPESTPDFKSSDLELDESDPNFAEYQRILQKFNVVDVCALLTHN